MSTEKWENQGIIVSNGSLTGNIIVAGKNASINTSASISALDQLRQEVTKLVSSMEINKVDSGNIDAAKVAEKELEKKEPNWIVVKSVLLSVIESIKTIGTVAGCALSVKKILDLI